MPDVLLEVTIAATPDKVFKALTEQPGLEAWWTKPIVAEPKVGSMIEASFNGRQAVLKMEVVTLEPAHKVGWSIRQGLTDWGGTHFTWDLSPVEKGTKLLFGYRGLAASADPWLPSLSYSWAVNLTRLKDYLEKGV